MVRIRRIGVIRTATVAAAMYAVLILFMTLVVFLPFALLAGAGAGASTRNVGGALGVGAIGVVGVLIFGLIGAFIYAAIGWVTTAVACVVYNFVAGRVGGIEIQLENVTPPQTPAWGGPYATPPGYGPPPGYGQGPSGTQPPPPGWGGQG